ncbi:MAG: 2-oxo-4-hydroxy-4-carboxy-5-ureidoimidazoline decarboxylase [Spongiibacteraceae bacterium]|nr:2-oxo-4-hydroxy-4-carboxy-5-ureidoimidazoline decarboxylase [Spongiibacteraceae bacterium]
MSGLKNLNHASEQQARDLFHQCCASDAWVDLMTKARPYKTRHVLSVAADRYWQGLREEDYLQAFAGHPKIGDVESLKDKRLAAGEQSGIELASEDVIHALIQKNAEYEKKYGFIFIVYATGKSAQDMLSLLQTRLHNSREIELQLAVSEQKKIFHKRLEKLL